MLHIGTPLTASLVLSMLVLLGGEAPRYLVNQGGDLFGVDPGMTRVDQGVYLLLAELAARF